MNYSNHPLADVGLKFQNFKCFGDSMDEYINFLPINIIIGRNNSGKSALIDIIDLCVSKGKKYDSRVHKKGSREYSIFVKQVLDEQSVGSVFREGYVGGGIPIDHWKAGKKIVGQLIERAIDQSWNTSEVSTPSMDFIERSSVKAFSDALVEKTIIPFSDINLFRIDAERDVQPEEKNSTHKLESNGYGTTNLVRAFINSDKLDRDEVEIGLLKDLNFVYSGDCEFSKILCHENDSDIWEIFLKEESKGDIRLSQSGSSLKSIFIILAMLRLMPIIDEVDWTSVVLAIEEPENNLHPALLRRLLNFLSVQQRKKRFTLLITTHSPVGIDWSVKNENSQIVHVRHNGKEAIAASAIGYEHNRKILDDLDIRASDILQANGIIWVEGPTERIYLKKWIDLFSKGKIKEGVHYSIMFYGGKLLSHLDALPKDESKTLISLLSINRNAAVVMDSDRHRGTSTRKPRMNLNETKKRIRDELEFMDGFVWITEGREIENYVPVTVFERLVSKKFSNIDQYTKMTEHPNLKKYKQKKVALAHAVVEEVTADDMRSHLDLWQQLDTLCQHIERWNGE
nr:AAA family ATPase [Sneathiella litorea]